MVMAVCLLAISSVAAAANYTLWVNGRTGGGVVGNDNSWTVKINAIANSSGICGNTDGAAQTGYYHANGNRGGIAGVVRSAVVNSAP